MASVDAGLQITTVLETTWQGDVLVGSSRERRGFDLAVDDAVSDAMLDQAFAAHARAARGRAGRHLAGLRPWLPDHRPAIGPSSAVAGMWLATGHEGAGVRSVPSPARLVAQLYAGEPPIVIRRRSPPTASDPEKSDGPAVSRPARRCVC